MTEDTQSYVAIVPVRYAFDSDQKRLKNDLPLPLVVTTSCSHLNFVTAITMTTDFRVCLAGYVGSNVLRI
jgi:hypothetical protein